ncbi:unnamed protein product [Clavelina lepadiformis]|uniref:Uncharacterized protein n=1 Tax=Clavelina lepadiformis TaxID=159417 RepID=A0ABP0F248_CLALP
MITSWILLICVSVVIAVGAASNCCFRKPDLPDNSECLLQILLIYDDVNESSVVEPIQFLNNGDIMPNNWKVNISYLSQPPKLPQDMWRYFDSIETTIEQNSIITMIGPRTSSSIKQVYSPDSLTQRYSSHFAFWDGSNS